MPDARLRLQVTETGNRNQMISQLGYIARGVGGSRPAFAMTFRVPSRSGSRRKLLTYLDAVISTNPDGSKWKIQGWILDTHVQHYELQEYAHFEAALTFTSRGMLDDGKIYPFSE
jgi:hypothetical protein